MSCVIIPITLFVEIVMLGRLKFEIKPLVNEILDNLPHEIWQSSTTTFLDPAMGGGQFLVEIQPDIITFITTKNQQKTAAVLGKKELLKNRVRPFL